MNMKPIRSVLDGNGAEFAVDHAGAAFNTGVVIDDEWFLDDAGDGFHRTDSRAFGTSLTTSRVDIEENQLLIGARQIFFNDALISFLMFQYPQNLTGNAFPQAAAGGMLYKFTKLGKKV